MDEKKIKIVWICHFSNAEIHDRLNLGEGFIKGIIRRILHKPLNCEVHDFAVWITNGIHEFEKINGVEFHIISPYPHLKNAVQELTINNVQYHFFRNEDDEPVKIRRREKNREYKRNRRIILQFVHDIQPDIVHLIGAENPYYSMALFDMPQDIPTIVQLQTLLSDPEFKNNYKNLSEVFDFRVEVEKRILRSATYIGVSALKYRTIIKEQVFPQAVFLNTILPITEPINREAYPKSFDFVYFSANISKAADLAIEAFALAYKDNPTITLDIIGGFSPAYKNQLDERIEALGIHQAIIFEGSLPSHEDVLTQIRKAKFALLPLRIDLTSSTIREAMSNGLPVLTTDTGELGTQKLNIERQSVLLSPIGDHQTLADNMLRLLYDESLADTLRQNAYQSRSEAKSNETIVKHYIEVYQACLDNFRNGTPLPVEVTQI